MPLRGSAGWMTGPSRAGRDGLEADCVLLWQKRDIGLLAHFIQQLQDAGERERAWKRYHAMRRFVEGQHCPRVPISLQPSQRSGPHDSQQPGLGALSVGVLAAETFKSRKCTQKSILNNIFRILVAAG